MTESTPSQALLQSVSRETKERLIIFADLVQKWSPKINLVAPGTLPRLWDRHICDSIQLSTHVTKGLNTWVDLGSGGGFPGIVLAILRENTKTTLVESDKRKAAFLRTALRETSTNGTVLAERIERISPLRSDGVSARALAPLDQLLTYADRHMVPDGKAFFMKGARYREEVEAALESWRFHCKEHPSVTQEGAVILEISEISRV